MFILKNPIMAAYILFLIICALWQAVCSFLGTEFSNWNQLIAAVTISSYFLSFNSVFTTVKALNEKLIFAFKESVAILEDTITNNRLSNLFPNDSDYKEINDIIAEEKNMIIQSEKSVFKTKIYIFLCYVLSFLLFFCIITFDGVFLFFEKSQDLYTLLAFIFVLGSEYIESIVEEIFQNKHQRLVGLTKSVEASK